MIAIIHVMLTQGELISKDHLRGLAAGIYQHEGPSAQRGPASENHLHDLAARIFQPEGSPARWERAQGVPRYIADIVNASVYTCIPLPAAQASFLWLNAREFEVVIETFHQGHLLRSSESVVRGLLHHLKQLDMKAQVNISLRAPADAQTYVSGKPKLLQQHLWDGLKNDLVRFIIGVIIVIIAKIWLTQFFQEAIGMLFILIFSSLWRAYTICNEARKRSICWRIHDD